MNTLTATAGARSLTRDGGEFDSSQSDRKGVTTTNIFHRIAYMINENSLQFNIVSKHLGVERMSHYLNEAAGDVRDLMLPTVENKAKL